MFDTIYILFKEKDMKRSISPYILIYFSWNCIEAMDQKKALEPNFSSKETYIKLRVHISSLDNTLQKSWIRMRVAESTTILMLKRYIAHCLQKPSTTFLVKKFDLTGEITYDDKSQKTISELGMVDKTLLWAVSINTENQKK